MLEKKLYDPKLVDIWSSGVTLFAMVYGTLPFDDPNLLDLYRKIKKGDF
jgi:serine/threonine protein kinase